MKAHHVTIILICALAAFVVASWGGLIQWWESASFCAKIRFCFFAWIFLLLCAFRAGTGWVVAGVIVGEAGFLVSLFLAIDQFFKEHE